MAGEVKVDRDRNAGFCCKLFILLAYTEFVTRTVIWEANHVLDLLHRLQPRIAYLETYGASHVCMLFNVPMEASSQVAQCIAKCNRNLLWSASSLEEEGHCLSYLILKEKRNHMHKGGAFVSKHWVTQRITFIKYLSNVCDRIAHKSEIQKAAKSLFSSPVGQFGILHTARNLHGT